MKVLIIYNQPGLEAAADERDVLDEVVLVEKHLQAAGHACMRLGIDLNFFGVVSAIDSFDPDVVFNLAESVENHGALVHVVPALLEVLDIPFTGNGSVPMFFCASKLLTHQRLQTAGLPVPAVHTPAEAASLSAGRYIVKPVWEEGSLGLDEDAVFDVPGANIPDIGRLNSEKYFVEEFIDGREFNVSLLCSEDSPQVLAVAEILFEDFPDDKPRVLGYRSKWDATSFEYHHTRRTFDLGKKGPEIHERLSTLSLKCWEVLGLRGYARVDFRMDATGRPYILEVNANPCISPDSGFYAACKLAGLEFTTVTELLIKEALK